MKYLLDANVLSETVRPNPNANVQKWLTEAPAESLYVSALTLGENILTKDFEAPGLELLNPFI